jgi:PAS domain S-box-containing protein
LKYGGLKMKEQEEMESQLHDLIEIIHFTEKVSTKIHGLLDEDAIFKTVKEESEKSKKYSMSITLLTDDRSKLRVAEVSLPLKMIKAAEKATGLQLGRFTIDLDKSSFYSQPVREGKTIQARFIDIVGELFPKPVASLVTKIIGYTNRSSILTPLKRHGTIIGVFSMSSTQLVEQFIPSVRNFAQHISTALELSEEYAERMQMEEALKKSEQKYRSIFENISDIYYRVDLEGTLVMTSPSGPRLLGYDSVEEVIGKNLAQTFYYNPDDRELFLEELKKYGKVTNFEILLKKKDGTPLIGETNSHFVYDDAGNPVAIEGIFRDISERRQAEDMLRVSEVKYRMLIENLNVGVYRVDPRGEGKLIDVNHAFISMLGYDSKEEILNLPVADLYLNPEKRKGVLEKISRQKAIKNEELILKKKDRTPITVSDTGRGIYDKDGNLQYFDGVIEDITERKKAEEELQEYRHQLEEVVEKRTAELVQINKQMEQEILDRKKIEDSLAAEKERLAVTLRSIGDGVITTDMESTVVLINKVAEGLTGWSQEEAVGKSLSTVFNIMSERTLTPCENPVEKVLREGAVVGLGNSTLLISKDGTERVIADSGAPIRDRDSKVIGVVLVFRDVTEKRKIEQEMQRTEKLESLGNLAGGIAHDFNNILTAILNNTTLAKMYAADNNVTEKLAKIEKASLQARELTQQLLTFSRGGAPVRKITSIEELIKDTVSFALRGSNVRCHFHFQEGLQPADIDEGQISQVINNLIINADQAMPEGGIIRVVAENVVLGEDTLPLQKGAYVKISVADQGVGIPKKHQQRIFDPYFTTKQKGSGLGLSTSYSIIKKHDGHMDVESDVGVGTTFYVWLPASREGKEEKVATIISEKEKPQGGEGRILLMDDEACVREAACEVLQYLGYTVQTAEDGKEALALYIEAQTQGVPFDAVIMDLTIPGGMGGKEAILALKKVDPQVKAIVASGYSTDPILANYKDYGFNGVVVKPYSIDELSRTLCSVLEEE